MTCDAVRERFSDLMDGELDETVRPRLEEHLRTCGGCRLEWAKFRQTVDAVRGMPQLSAPKGFADEMRQQLERAELLDREAAPTPSRMGWQRPLMLLAAAAMVLVVARVGLESRLPAPRDKTPSGFPGKFEGPDVSREGLADTQAPSGFSGGASPAPPDLAWKEPVPDSTEGLQDKGGGGGPRSRAPALDAIQHGATHDPARTAPEEASRELADLADAVLPAPGGPALSAASAPPSAPPSPAATPGGSVPPPMPALAWVMPCADAEAGERRLRDALAPGSRDESQDLKAKLESESGQRGAEAGSASLDGRIERKTPRILTLKVRSAELKETTRRLEALGARPAPGEDEAVRLAGRLDRQPARKPADAEMRQRGGVETEAVAEGGIDADGAQAGQTQETAKADALKEEVASDVKAIGEGEKPSSALRKDLRAAAAPEEWITLTIALEPVPEAQPDGDKP